ncbi:MAG: hypothetical protein H6850_03510 [Alphaproteobacteria bacterium]|nr:MAG: hypothetical protein H6850_03510 [Alphaproteobacteria bacterium]
MKKIAIVGATGNVGEIIAKKLKNKADLTLFSSKDALNFKGFDICIFATQDDVSKQFVPEALKAGATVIDASSYYRLEKDVPLIVAPVNGTEVRKKLISSANCIASPLSLALNPIKSFGIESIHVSTYQSISGAGRSALEKFEKEKVLNLTPQISSMMDDGVTQEEYKIIHETQKILNLECDMSVIAVRVPVLRGHSMSVSVKLKQQLTLEQLSDIYRHIKEIQFLGQEYKTPAEIEGSDLLYIGRVRINALGVHMWLCSDNLHRGAALDVVEIVDLLLNAK